MPLVSTLKHTPIRRSLVFSDSLDICRQMTSCQILHESAHRKPGWRPGLQHLLHSHTPPLKHPINRATAPTEPLSFHQGEASAGIRSHGVTAVCAQGRT